MTGRDEDYGRKRSRSPDMGGDGRGAPPPQPGVPNAGIPAVPMGGAMPGGGMAAMGQVVPLAGAASAIPGLGVPPILAAQNAAQDKVNRELFVGNTPPGTSEMLLIQFLSGAMRRTGLCKPSGSPIVTCRVNQKFAFVECATVDCANRALNLNGIPFLGSCLKVSRPSKYAGPFVPSKSWQELTGTALPNGLAGAGGALAGSAEDKINRELFIGNTTPEMTEQMLSDFLGKAMEQVGLSKAPGNPIVTCRTSGKFAFIELRTTDEAASALNLNNIPYLGAQLRVGRPSKYTGPETPHGNWEDILAKYMSGELQLPSKDGGGGAAPAPAAPHAIDATCVVELCQMLTQQDLENDDEYKEILEDTTEECGQFGSLKRVVIPRSGPGATKIFLEYATKEDAARAIASLAGRTFDGRKVTAVYYDEARFAAQDYKD
uniref:RRM domain-containing protein n=1 Tax=Odontella aurita TaxID=265563 RepID=A0A7S4I336_9STRA|mmetsp:Transcript_18999/g.55146  ORF Transcript_18999/g.55146 Transcript_18999/m.55146 type:complete len:432 (+) Transcript_18999:207-1502(+)|eukprot:CAMPEP_0113556420 /NCGR_PEP_ID=MMETSP0015_2-20120614/17247_1 /TAXON_ID=2838 /ORGANISM="Odontella" /LENGTH=431 /DNA_ID=CAMNT_0000457775 /DNA_START=111 /DNA_END=1406 /DNA_ORIENTATION=- /assembly_acc=CAM_ASM_000160